jgi:hypothetical protein
LGTNLDPIGGVLETAGTSKSNVIFWVTVVKAIRVLHGFVGFAREERSHHNRNVHCVVLGITNPPGSLNGIKNDMGRSMTVV